MAEFIEKEFKTIINKRKYIDDWFWSKYGVNPYNGCQFGCIYCDSRSDKYRLPSDFDSRIIIKTNVKEMLDKRISRARTFLPDVVAVGGACDPYQPVETKFGNTRAVLEVLNKHSYPAHVITKSNLVLRDGELMEEIGRKSWGCVSVTITTTDSGQAKFLEEKAPSPDTRFNTIEKIKTKYPHIQSGVLLMPVVPGLTDTEVNIREIVKRAKNTGADFVLYGGGMTMRDSQAVWFLSKLTDKYPGLIALYEKIYDFKFKPGSYSGNYEPDWNYSPILAEAFYDECRKLNMPYRIKRYIPDDYRKENYIISERLLNRAYELRIRGRYWKNDFWAGQAVQNLKEPLRDVVNRNELHTVNNVKGKIREFIEKWMNDNQ